MRNENSFDALHEAWLTARGTKLVPARADISFTRMGEIVSDLSLLEATADGNLIVRFAGPGVVERTKTDPLSENLLEMLPSNALTTLQKLVRISLGQPCVMCLKLFVGDEMTIDSRHMPVARDDGTVAYLMSTTQASDTAAYDADARHWLSRVDRFEMKGIDIGAGLPDDLPSI